MSLGSTKHVQKEEIYMGIGFGWISWIISSLVGWAIQIAVMAGIGYIVVKKAIKDAIRETKQDSSNYPL